jgi:hypothetical protein
MVTKIPHKVKYVLLSSRLNNVKHVQHERIQVALQSKMCPTAVFISVNGLMTRVF